MSLRRILNLAVTVICFGILLSVTIYVIVNWQDMPDQLPHQRLKIPVFAGSWPSGKILAGSNGRFIAPSSLR